MQRCWSSCSAHEDSAQARALSATGTSSLRSYELLVGQLQPLEIDDSDPLHCVYGAPYHIFEVVMDNGTDWL